MPDEIQTRWTMQPDGTLVSEWKRASAPVKAIVTPVTE